MSARLLRVPGVVWVPKTRMVAAGGSFAMWHLRLEGMPWPPPTMKKPKTRHLVIFLLLLGPLPPG